MKILIIGGSNSLMTGGYVAHLRQSLQPFGGAEIVQLSVGATTSLSAIGRLHEHHAQAGAQQFDVILYEYGINDAGHFASRSGGAESWRLCLHLLIKTAAKLYPSAILVPLVLAQRRQFAAAVPHPFYDTQIAEYTALKLNCVDIRAFMSALFMEQMPDWMYRDEAHYDAPHATSIIGALVARRLLELVAQKAEHVAQVCARMQATSPFATLDLMYVPAVNLQQFVTGPAQPAHAENRLMRVDYLRMLPGSRLELRSAMFPLALFLKSDACHDALQLDLGTEAGLSFSARVATRHADTEAFSFIYSSIPLPLLWSETLVTPFGPSTLAVGVPPQAGGAQVGFDCYAGGKPGAPERYLDLVGILLLVQG
jgi:hypothetical protein